MSHVLIPFFTILVVFVNFVVGIKGSSYDLITTSTKLLVYLVTACSSAVFNRASYRLYCIIIHYALTLAISILGFLTALLSTYGQQDHPITSTVDMITLLFCMVYLYTVWSDYHDS
ncbi:unnamed protein product [Rotaria socialis]|nr:unnamed protein product [Rotaria socialis]CAF4359066.1 unnamed protein product [Rotaria socialis]CAF4857538.1 unnamed protein product [Rotaria socialis]